MANYVSNNIYETRTAGQQAAEFQSIQSWKSKKTTTNIETATAQPAQQKIINNLEKAAHGQVGVFDVKIDNSLAYANPNQRIETPTPKADKESFHFGDVVDVVNPLHHLPVVGMVYRGITGDELHPMSQIIGGTIYGGPVGAVTSTANAITKMQTGKDIGEHALSFAGLSEYESSKPTHVAARIDDPITQLDNTSKALANNQPLQDLPASTLSFVNLSEPHYAHQQIKVASGRTAGHMAGSYKQISTVSQPASQQPSTMNTALQAQEIAFSGLPKRENITQVSLSAMPPRRDS